MNTPSTAFVIYTADGFDQVVETAGQCRTETKDLRDMGCAGVGFIQCDWDQQDVIIAGLELGK